MVARCPVCLGVFSFSNHPFRLSHCSHTFCHGCMILRFKYCVHSQQWIVRYVCRICDALSVKKIKDLKTLELAVCPNGSSSSSFYLNADSASFKKFQHFKISNIDPSDLVHTLRCLISEVSKLPLKHLKLSFRNKILDDKFTIQECGLLIGDTVYFSA